ncbi:MAG: adenosine kinase [Bacteroidales bacterium]|nr:adenosine kinase [Bacteroidales bacterium]
MMKRVIGIGNALVDVMTRLNDYSILERLGYPGGSMQLVDLQESERIKSETAGFVESLTPGGSAANTVHGLAMLGMESGFIGSVGSDYVGDLFEKELKKAGVDAILKRRSSPTGTAVAMITPDSERTFATHLGAAVELSLDDISPLQMDGYHILYLEGYLIINYELVKRACETARSLGMKVAVDLASYNVVENFREQFNDLVDNYADIVFANEEEALALTGQPTEEALDNLALRCDIAVVKTGSRGSLIRRGDEKVRVGVLGVNPVDTTGAGDLYAAGFLYGLAQDEPLDICGAMGTLLAGNVIEVMGPKMDLERWKRITGEILAMGKPSGD